jgi:small subunit ribosomal protein S1
MVGQTLKVKIIEINRGKRRLILSARAAQREHRQQQRDDLLSELREGEVRRGRVSSLCTFGAFVDLGGADGLIHLSELRWQRVRHPKEVVHVGQEVEVYVLRLDRDRGRIGLSLKRLQPEPWSLIEDKYELGQLIEGMVTNVVDFGAFAQIEEGIEGLIHISELADSPVEHPRQVVKKGDLLLLRIIRIDTRRKRLGLSLKRVLESEWAEWAARLAVEEAEAEQVSDPVPVDAEPLADSVVEEPEAFDEPVAEEAAAELPEDPIAGDVPETEEQATVEAVANVESFQEEPELQGEETASMDAGVAPEAPSVEEGGDDPPPDVVNEGE